MATDTRIEVPAIWTREIYTNVPGAFGDGTYIRVLELGEGTGFRVGMFIPDGHDQEDDEVVCIWPSALAREVGKGLVDAAERCNEADASPTRLH